MPFVLAHELSHLYKRHTIKELQYRLISSAAGFSIAKKLLEKMNQNAPSSLIPDFVSNVQLINELMSWVRENQVRYQMDQEFEADACALNWLIALNIEPRKAWHVFGDILSSDGPDKGSSYANTHPSPDERISNIDKAMASLAAPNNVAR